MTIDQTPFRSQTLWTPILFRSRADQVVVHHQRHVIDKWLPGRNGFRFRIDQPARFAFNSESEVASLVGETAKLNGGIQRLFDRFARSHRFGNWAKVVELEIDVGRKDGFWTSGVLHDVAHKIVSLLLSDPSASFDDFYRNPLAVKEPLRRKAIASQEFDERSQSSRFEKVNRHLLTCPSKN